MRRLADGYYALIANETAPCAVHHIETGDQISVSSAERVALARLAQGMPEASREDDRVFRFLSERGAAVETAIDVDPVIEERLRTLGQGYTWLLDADPRAAALTKRLRRVHARRKVFFPEYGQTPVLPEIAAFRCLVVDRALARAGDVLHVGDDDLLSIGMAALGHRPVVLDIDPLLITFLRGCAADEGLGVQAEITDITAPLAHEWIGAFDAALSDPMSYENCQLAFLSRACAGLSPGGVLCTTAHPLARDVCERVYARLPVREQQLFAQRNTYYWLGYETANYRSDLVLLERVEGDLPFAPTDTIPLSHLIDGALTEKLHGVFETRGIRGLGKGPVTPAVLIAAAEACAPVRILGSSGFSSPRHVYAALFTEEGHVALTYDRTRSLARMIVYPFVEEHQARWHQVLAELVRPMRQSLYQMQAYEMPPRPYTHAPEGLRPR